MTLSSTLVRKLFHKGDQREYCPLKIYKTVLGDLDYRTLAMEQGAFFETLCLGSGRDGEQVTDLPRRLNGSKRIAHIRIEQQAKEFHRLCRTHQIYITEENTQVQITKKLADDVFLSGHIDIFPVGLLDPEIGYTLGIIDLKLAKNIHNTWGEYCWGMAEDLDDIQAQIYLFLIEDVDFGINPHLDNELFHTALKHDKKAYFYWWVFDYKPKTENVFIRAEKSELKRMELIETLRKTYKLVRWHEKNGWGTNPSKENCESCPLKDMCDDYYRIV